MNATSTADSIYSTVKRASFWRRILPTVAGFLTGILVFLILYLFNMILFKVEAINARILLAIIMVPIFELRIRQSLKPVLARILVLMLSIIFLSIWLIRSSEPMILADILTKDAGIYAFVSGLLLSLSIVDIFIVHPKSPLIFLVILLLFFGNSFAHRIDVNLVETWWSATISLVQYFLSFSMIWVVLIDIILSGLWLKETDKNWRPR